MKLLCLLLAPTVVLVSLTVSVAWQYEPPPPTAPDTATMKTLVTRGDKLAQELDRLRRQGVRDHHLADVAIYHKAALWLVRHGEFYAKNSADMTLAVLDQGLLRASQVARGESPWLSQTGQSVARAYRSRIDGSLQPYAVTLPADYGKDTQKKWRLDVVLHGRNAALTEVSFLHQHNGDKPAPKDQPFVQISIYGRGNNAYRWAGEIDVVEAVENFLTVERVLGRGNWIDPNRTVLRGFSMGGAGTWHLGLHRPDQWCVLGPGAGFTTTHGYIKDLPAKLSAAQEACLHIYDAVDCAENAFNVPVVAYGGDQDPQLQAARNIQAKLKPLDIPMTLLVAPGLAHQFPLEWQKKAEEEYEKHLQKGRPEYPNRIHFVTWTMRYPSCYWVNVMGLKRHYERALVDAERNADEGFTVKTENVRVLGMALWSGATQQPLTVKIDGQKLEVRPYHSASGDLHVYLERREGAWVSVLPEKVLTDRLRVPQKLTGLQGPIDDAFMDSFLCVRGTGKPWHEATQQYAEANLQRFATEWSKFLRGDLPIKDDVEVTPQDLAGRNMVLFGDPASNSLIGQVLPGLPLRWTKEQIVWENKAYPAADHVPVLIYPSPLASNRYVVLNSGHTFHAADFLGTNALLYPRLGDHALLKRVPAKKDPLATEVLRAGVFDDFWRFAPALGTQP